jgi:hypothetical protein
VRLSKVKNWKRREVAELRVLVNVMSNPELCNHFVVETPTLFNALRKYHIKRDPEFGRYLRVSTKEGENNPNWRHGISKDGARYQAIQRARHPEHKKARQAVYEAIKRGDLLKPTRCEDCGQEKPLQGHHESYEKEHWLEVRWVCRKCHRKIHGDLH